MPARFLQKNSLMEVPLYMISIFSLAVYKVVSLFLMFNCIDLAQSPFSVLYLDVHVSLKT